jgi:CubicO group peptidase (beta-lactamase class C family)
MLPDTKNSDPVQRQMMAGFPPAPDRIARVDNGSHYGFPNSRWTFSHWRDLLPTVNVWRGSGAVSSLPLALRDDLDSVAYTTMDGRDMTWGQSLDELCVDGILVLHRGRVLYERYFGALAPHRTHIAFSMTKSFVGLLAAMLQHEGRIDPNKLVPHYLPELAGTAYATATVAQVMDMTIGVQYSETYSDPKAEVWAYATAMGSFARPHGYSGPDSIFDFLKMLKPEGRHGEAFAYKTCNTEVLGWILQRAANMSFADLVSERLWQRLGCEENADLSVDRTGMAMCGGGLNFTLRDAARFGEMMRLGGRFNGQQIVPEAVVADIARGANPEHFAKAGYDTLPGSSYRHQWWVMHDRFGAYQARGIHGQVIWIAPRAEMVIVRFASYPVAANANGPLDYLSMPGYAAIADHVTRNS